MVKYSTSAQTTIGDSVRLVGIGVHSGKRVAMTLHPADTNTGIVFLR
ncbi:UDP-3-O-acyl-N-acetylglucosamine deacetylase, partial [Acinetobacter baumannii]